MTDMSAIASGTDHYAPPMGGAVTDVPVQTSNTGSAEKQETTTSRLANTALLVSLVIHAWTARKHDLRVSNQVAEDHNAPVDAGRYNKRLIPMDTPSYLAIKQHISVMRSFHYDNTLPWSQEGSRILSSANYMTYANGMRKLKQDYATKVQAFLSDYRNVCQTAKERLNGLYREEDYPSNEAIRDKFGVDLVYLPMPAAEDFRMNVGESEARAIRAQITAEVERATVVAMKDLWGRLYSVVQRMAIRLAEPKGRFTDTLVENVRDLCALLPKLNLTNDTQLEQMRQDVETALSVHSPETLRNNDTLRADVARQAAEIATKMGDYMRGAS